LNAGSWHRWEDNIKMDIKEIICIFVNYIYLVQEMLQGLAQGQIYSCGVPGTIKIRRPLSVRKKFRP
jgi:hypothetical protein